MKLPLRIEINNRSKRPRVFDSEGKLVLQVYSDYWYQVSEAGKALLSAAIANLVAQINEAANPQDENDELENISYD